MSETKYVIVIPDGCSDEPIEALGGKTPMEYANTPHLDALAARSLMGRSFNVPDGLPPGSDVATLNLLGYDPQAVYTGRAPLEALAQRIPLEPFDQVFRCNLVCIADGIMKSFTAGHISSNEAKEILATLQEKIAPRWNDIVSAVSPEARGKIEFIPGVSYRNLLLYRPEDVNGAEIFTKVQTFPPHDLTDQPIGAGMPQGEAATILLLLMEEIQKELLDHPVNKARISQGKLPATMAWLWGQGKRPALERFAKRFPTIRGSMITAVDLLRGIAIALDWDIIDVPNITGYIDTDYQAKGNYAAGALDDYNLVCVHVEATDEAGHEGSLEKKVMALEDIDKKVIPPILDKLQSFDNWRLLVSPDHPTPVRIKTHSRDCVPWLIAGSDIQGNKIGQSWSESSAATSPLFYQQGHRLIDFFLQ